MMKGTKYIKLFDTEANYSAYINGSEVYLPNVSLVEENHSVKYNPKPSEKDWSKEPLTFEILGNGNIVWGLSSEMGTPSGGKTISYKKNDGNWTSITAAAQNPPTISVQTGDIVQFKGNNASYIDSETASVSSFAYSTTCRFNVMGNIMSLVDSNNYTTLGSTTAVFTLFFNNCTGLTDASKLVLPATNMAENCYDGMFEGCSSLTAAPALPATTLASYCYYYMFRNCSSLVAAPEILPATTLMPYCYNMMFNGCSSLITAPEISATIVAQQSCTAMFMNCSSLTTAPELRATTLAPSCYMGMFMNCSHLSNIKCLATDISASNCVGMWTNGVAASGTFTKKAGVSWPSGTDGIPNGWSVVEV